MTHLEIKSFIRDPVLEENLAQNRSKIFHCRVNFTSVTHEYFTGSTCVKIQEIVRTACVKRTAVNFCGKRKLFILSLLFYLRALSQSTTCVKDVKFTQQWKSTLTRAFVEKQLRGYKGFGYAWLT